MAQAAAGGQQHAPPCLHHPPPGHSTESSILDGGTPLPAGIGLFLMQLTVILITTKLLALVLKKFHQPSVVAEVLGGIVLGPSLLGSIPGYLQHLFPPQSMGGFGLIANFGLVLYLFLVGLELDPAQIMKTGPAALKIAVAGIAVPFAFGGLVAILLHKEQSKDPAYASVPLSSMAVFTGVGMSITAFPVLARILTETTLITQPIGVMTLSAAAFNDAVAWCLLAVAIALVQSGSPVNAVYIFFIMLAYCAFLFIAVRPLLFMAVKRVNALHSSYLRSTLLGLVFVCIFVSGWFMQIIGLDAIFGAFLVGVILPRDEGLVHVVEKFEDIVRVVFLPLYFTLSGLKTNIASVSGAHAIGLFLLVLALAVAGKLIGCMLAARVSGLAPRESLAIGLLMNTRGLVELIVLNLGLQAKVIDEEIFTIMVLMALVTTFMTTPAIRFFYPKSMWVTPLVKEESGGAEALDMAMAADKAGIQGADSSKAVAGSTSTSSRKGLRGPGKRRKEGGGAEARREQRLVRGPACRRASEAGLTYMLPAEQASSMVRALFMILPADARSTTVITTLFYDSLTTTAVVNQRLGYVDDPDAQQIRLAGQLFGAAMLVETIPATGNVAEELVPLMTKGDVDVCVLPWSGGDSKVSHVAYQDSTWDTLPKVEGIIILFHDGYNLRMPQFLAKSDSNKMSGGCCFSCSVLVLLHGEGTDETAVLDVMERMMLRDGIQLCVCTYGAVSKQTGATLARHGITTTAAEDEEDLTLLLEDHDVELVMYTGAVPNKHRGNNNNKKGGAGSKTQQDDDDDSYMTSPRGDDSMMMVMMEEIKVDQGHEQQQQPQQAAVDEAEELPPLHYLYRGRGGTDQHDDDQQHQGTTREIVSRVLSRLPEGELSVMEVHRGTATRKKRRRSGGNHNHKRGVAVAQQQQRGNPTPLTTGGDGKGMGTTTTVLLPPSSSSTTGAAAAAASSLATPTHSSSTASTSSTSSTTSITAPPPGGVAGDAAATATTGSEDSSMVVVAIHDPPPVVTTT